MNFRLVSKILRGAWAIDEKHALANGSLIYGILSSTATIDDHKTEYSAIAFDKSWKQYKRMEDAPHGSVAVISIKGEMVKDSEDSVTGTEEIRGWVQKADGMDNITSIILKIDSPGGTVDGTEVFGDVVKNAKKPVIAFVDGLMASAAFWIGSAADKIYASTPLDGIGSVGVVLSFMDMRPKWEAKGVVFHTIVSSKSPDKLGQMMELLKGEYDNFRTNVLDQIAERFQMTVKNNRPSLTDELLTGKLYFAKDLIGTMIDGVKSFEEVLSEAFEDGQAYINNQNKIVMKTKLIEKLGLKADASEDIILGAVDGIKQNVLDLQAKAETSEQEKKEADQKVTDAQARITELENEITGMETLRINSLLDQAVADRRITQDQKAHWKSLLEKDFESASASLEGISTHQSVMNIIKGDGNDSRMTLKEMRKKDPRGLMKMRRENPEDYKALFVAEYGVEPK